ncbi:ATP-binding protein [Hymenobacter sp. BT770]|uniref:ATP-binding protein n=1 Tax=Hymenobacter sp. BT770 TaxID=2886942 RepID=UPI001D1020EA|nr:ATP-binding protein [Hymenobacter sp. BT770]MCC3154228.1 histidine kinase [Hymenobacter sp. BT770]MDO3416392.1 ATP-binding protein [Hymenobacter sp. BT770]
MSNYLLRRLKRAGLLFSVLLLLFLSVGPLAAQTRPRRYWEADPDSLRRVLAGQHTDTARLRTLLHLNDIGDTRTDTEVRQLIRETERLARRLRRPEADAFRLWENYAKMDSAGVAPARLLDTLRAMIKVAARSHLAVVGPLYEVGDLFNKLKQPEARLAYFQAKLAQYSTRGARENMAACHVKIGGYYLRKGDYNQGISHYLRAAELEHTFNRFQEENELKVAGSYYAEWGNSALALHYLRQALHVHEGLPRQDKLLAVGYTYRGMAQAYRQLGNPAAALRYANLALVSLPANDTVAARKEWNLLERACGLVLKSEVLLDARRGAKAGPLLAQAQRLGDSLQIHLFTTHGNFELDATRARYYAARGNWARAETAWRAAYDKAQHNNRVSLRLVYARELARFFDQRGQAGLATGYYRTAAALADTLERTQGALHVANFEYEKADRAQTARIAQLRDTQLREAAQARQQRRVLWAVLAGAALLVALAAVLYYAFRRSERLKHLVIDQKQDLQAQRDQLNTSLTELRTTQAQLVQREKMASLGELTAGIAHEIQNPLNFVNNFSEVSAELLDELAEEQARPERDAELEAEMMEDLRQNMAKITQHGKRAASIVKGMLEHSQISAGERQPTDLNRLADEYMRLAYQGLRAKDKTFNATLSTYFLADLPPVTVVGADVGRVLLNLFTNAFYAVRQRQQAGEPGYQPQVGVRTIMLNQQVQIQVTDNGTGMPESVKQKIFQPFFTTKPTGEGTGLGLSLSHDIIAQGHGGTLTMESQEGEGTTFCIGLPVNAAV